MDFAFFDPLGGNPRGQRGRPPQRDYVLLNEMARHMLRDPTLSKTDAAWKTVRPKAGRRGALPFHKSDVTRLVRKFREHPWVFNNLRDHYERKVKTVLDGAKGATLSLKFAGVLTRSHFDVVFFSQFPLCWEVIDDARVVKAADEVWKQVRPSKLMLTAMGYDTNNPHGAIAMVARGLTPMWHKEESRLFAVDKTQSRLFEIDMSRPDAFTRYMARGC